MAAADTSVRYMHWLQAGAPQINGAIGASIPFFDTVLTTGFGLSSVDSAVVATNVCTLNISAGHSQIKDGVVTVAGVTAPAGLNGDWKVKSITASTVTFDTAGIADQTATGTITAKVASLGWSKPFSGTNKAAYKSSDPASNGHYLRIEDLTTSTMRARGYEAMTTVDAGTGLFPTDVQLSGGFWWAKSTTTDTVNRPWIIIGDGRIFHFWLAQTTAATEPKPFIAEFMTFGEGVKKLPSDVFDTFISGANTSTGITSSNGVFQSLFKSGGSNTYNYFARSMLNTGTSEPAEMKAECQSLSNLQMFSGSASTRPFPPPDGKVKLWKLSMFSPNTVALANGGNTVAINRERSVIPGVYVFDCAVAPILNTFDVLAAPELPGRNLLVLRSDTTLSTTPVAGVIDITGPWR